MWTGPHVLVLNALSPSGPCWERPSSQTSGSEAIMEPPQCQCRWGSCFYQLLHFLFISKNKHLAIGLRGLGLPTQPQGWQ